MHPPASAVLPPISLGDVEIADEGTEDLDVQVLGSSFSSVCLVYLDHHELETRFVSDTELRARIPRRFLTDITSEEPRVDVRIPPGTPHYPGGARSPFARVTEPAPELHSISPETIDSEPSAPFLVTVRGKNLVNGSEAVFRGGRFRIALSHPREGTVELPPSVVDTSSDGGLLHVEVPVPGSSGTPYIKTAARPLKVTTPAPVIAGIWPPTLNAVDKLQGKAGAAKTASIEVSGTQLRSTTVVKWNGKPLTTFASPFAGRIWANLPLDARRDASTARITLETPSPQGPLESASHPLAVKTAPVLYTVSPAWVQARSTNVITFELRGEGLGESGQQVLLWNGTPLAPETFKENPSGPPNGSWTFTVPGHLLTLPGVFPVTVKRTYDGVESAPLFVHVVSESPTPIVYELRPSVLSVGDAPGSLTLGGAGFTGQSTVLINGQARPTRFHEPGNISTDISPSDLEQKGVLTLTVQTPAPGGGTSLPLLLPVHEESPQPSIDAVMGPGGENPVLARNESMALHLTGKGFTPRSVVHWAGQALPTQWQCPTPACIAGHSDQALLVASVPEGWARTPGAVRVTVLTPGSGGGESRPRYLVLTAGVETTLTLSPRDLDIGASKEGNEQRVSFTARGRNGAQVARLFVDGRERSFNHTDSSFSLSPEETSSERIFEIRTEDAGRSISAPVHLYVHGAKTPILFGLIPGVISRDSRWLDVPHPVLWSHGWDFSWTYGSARQPLITMNVSVPGNPSIQDIVHPESRLPFARLAVDVPGVRTVTVSRVAEGGGASLGALLNVVPERPAPLLMKLEPMSVSRGDPRLRLRIWGKGFHPTSQLRWKEFRSSLKPVFDSIGDTNHFEADLPAAALETPGGVDVTIETPPPGGGTSLPIRVVVE
ncbi:hypothetical protein [Myxococcus stipitatus]|uniref:hypothetical protein n=1 Tax=Myxococcus stipitatus TaxID=83455 RepID=UPI0030CC8D01